MIKGFFIIKFITLSKFITFITCPGRIGAKAGLRLFIVRSYHRSSITSIFIHKTRLSGQKLPGFFSSTSKSSSVATACSSEHFAPLFEFSNDAREDERELLTKHRRPMDQTISHSRILRSHTISWRTSRPKSAIEREERKSGGGHFSKGAPSIALA